MKKVNPCFLGKRGENIDSSQTNGQQMVFYGEKGRNFAGTTIRGKQDQSAPSVHPDILLPDLMLPFCIRMAIDVAGFKLQEQPEVWQVTVAGDL